MKNTLEPFFDDIKDELDTFFDERGIDIEDNDVDDLSELIIKLFEDYE